MTLSFLPIFWRSALRWLLCCSYAAGIFYLSSREWPTPSNFPEGTDKVIHFSLYFIFAGLTLWALQLTHLRQQKKSIWIALIFAAAYGASDEIHQYFVPGRSMSIFDWYADLAGSCFGVLVAWKLAKWKNLRKEKKYAHEF